MDEITINSGVYTNVAENNRKNKRLSVMVAAGVYEAVREPGASKVVLNILLHIPHIKGSPMSLRLIYSKYTIQRAD